MPHRDRSAKKLADRLAVIRRTMAELALEAERLMHEAERMAEERQRSPQSSKSQPPGRPGRRGPEPR